MHHQPASMPALQQAGVRSSPAGVVIDNTMQSISVTCTLVSGEFQSSDLDCSSIRLRVTGRDSCGNVVATADAVVSVTLAPYLRFGAVIAPSSICASENTVTAGIPFTVKHGSVNVDNFAVTGASCARQIPAGVRLRCQVSVCHAGCSNKGTWTTYSTNAF